jgi:hypothetical protein
MRFDNGRFLEIKLDATKTQRIASKVEGVDLTPEESGPVLESLLDLVQESQRLGFPITQYVFRPSEKFAGFKDKPLSTNSATGQLIQYMKKLGIWAGHTINSTLFQLMKTYTGSAPLPERKIPSCI